MRRRALVAAGLALVTAAAFLAAVANAVDPLITITGAPELEATNPGGAPLSYTATASDDDLPGSIPVDCNPAPGLMIPVDGSQLVTCSATDVPDGNLVQETFIQSVVDTTGPTFSGVPAGQVVPAGTVVNYTPPTANDLVDLSRPVNCNPAPGFTANATTQVTCTASDTRSNDSQVSFTFTVDTAAPVFSNVPPGGTVDAGTVVNYTPPTAIDAVDGPRPVECNPAPGFTANVTTTVVCTASDLATPPNVAQVQFTFTVENPNAPVVQAQTSRTAEATGPFGASVYFPDPVSASDAEDGPLLAPCVPSSGSLFPLGMTFVICSVTDSDGNIGQTSFPVTVQDTRSPEVGAPRDLVLTSPDPVPATSVAIQSWAALSQAEDIADPNPVITNDAVTVFPLGTTTVRFTATDASGNTATASSTVTVQTEPGGRSPDEPVPDAFAPGLGPRDVQNLTAVPKNATVKLTWQNSPGSAGVTITRFTGGGASRTPSGADGGKVVYEGAGTKFTDKDLKAWVEYTYRIQAFDKTGETSLGLEIVVVAKAAQFVKPKEGATVKKPPLLDWKGGKRQASYWNVQLWDSSDKVLSAWPNKSRFKLRRTWRFEGARQGLRTGNCYTAYVWPGKGPKKNAKYGPLYAQIDFCFKKKS